MIRVFYGDNRVEAEKEIRRLLGDDYEVLDGAEIDKQDLPSVFFGASLFAKERKILIRDFTANREVYGELIKYLETPHEIILLETKLDKRAAAYKELKDKIEFREFKLVLNEDYKVVFEVYHTAKRDGKKAVEMLEKIRINEDPIKIMGLIVSQATKDYMTKQGARERWVLKELARADIEMKTTKIDPWLIVESFLLRVNSKLI